MTDRCNDAQDEVVDLREQLDAYKEALLNEKALHITGTDHTVTASGSGNPMQGNAGTAVNTSPQQQQLLEKENHHHNHHHNQQQTNVSTGNKKGVKKTSSITSTTSVKDEEQGLGTVLGLGHDEMKSNGMDPSLSTSTKTSPRASQDNTVRVLKLPPMSNANAPSGSVLT